MGYRQDLISMDAHTILFVRKNRDALAYHWDFYVSNISLISKLFLHEPAVDCFFKATDDPLSWVDYKLARDDGRYENPLKHGVNETDDIPQLCEAAFAKGNRLISNTGKIIPNAIYIDQEGFEYRIPINDGREKAVLCQEFTVGGPGEDNIDVELEQCSVSNLKLSFKNRHLMDDLKLRFRNHENRGNNIISFNAITVPLVIDESDVTLGYIRNALRMSSFNSLQTKEGEFSLPLSPIAIGSSKKQFSRNEDVDGLDCNRYIMTSWGTLFKIDANNALWKTRNLNDLENWVRVHIPPFIDEYLDVKDVRNKYIKDLNTNGNFLTIVPGPNNTIIAFEQFDKEDVITINADELDIEKIAYYVSNNDGVSWKKCRFTNINGVGSTTRKFIVYNVPNPEKDTSVEVFILSNSDGTQNVANVMSTNGVVWEVNPITAQYPQGYGVIEYDGPLSDIDYRAYHIFLMASCLYTNDLIKVPYINSKGNVFVKHANGKFLKLTSENTTPSLSMPEIRNYIKNKIIERNPDLNLFGPYINEKGGIDVNELNLTLQWEANLKMLRVGYCFMFMRMDNPDIQEDRTEYYESGIFVVNSTIDGFVYETPKFTINTLDNVMKETGQKDKNSAFGRFTIQFQQGLCWYIDGKWVIRDTLVGEDYLGNVFDNRDIQKGYVYRVSSDFLHWYPVRNINGEHIGNTPLRPVITNDKDTILFVSQDNAIHVYAMPFKTKLHYNFRVNIHKWTGVNLTQQVRGSYVKTGPVSMHYDTDTPPYIVGFPCELNPNATILLYNGVPIIDGSAYVNPENPKEMIVNEMIAKHAFIRNIWPIQYKYGDRKYRSEDFSVIVASSKDPTKDVYAFMCPGRITLSTKEIYVDFNSDVAGDFILFNGINHEYVITHRKGIKYIFSRYSLQEAMVAGLKFNTVGYSNHKVMTKGIYRLQFLSVDKKS